MTSRGVDLAACFLERLPEDLRQAEETPDLAERLLEKWRIGQDEHPDVTLAPEAFAGALGDRRSDREFLLDEVFSADFFLAVAALAGDRVALRTFEEAGIRPLYGALRRGGALDDVTEEVVRTVRESMFLGTPRRPPKLAVYTGQVPLLAWLRVVAQRELLTFLRKQKREIPTSALEDLGRDVAERTPELLALKRVDKTRFEGALQAAMSTLEPDERRILHWHLKEGLGIDDIAPRLGVHRATAARMLTRVRKRLFDGVRADLRKTHRMGSASIDSLCAHMAADLDLTLSRIL
ncbi:MAG: sigma-70 family RNA polymerase sigma factor [Polyangiaceae bacterium]|nr:sigma-70 family RNA polymerase sigma factor [Polyangiaceae bacterium]